MLILACLACGNDDADGDLILHAAPMTGVNYSDVWATESGDVIAVGSRGAGGAVSIREDGTWTSESIPAVTLPAVWSGSSSVGDAWVGGRSQDDTSPVLYRHSSSGWEPQDAAVLGESEAILGYVSDVWGTGPDDIWVIAARERRPVATESVFHWNGVVWTEHTEFWEPPPEEPGGSSRIELKSGCRLGDNDVLVGGSQIVGPGEPYGRVYHWDGESWETLAVDGCQVLVSCHGETATLLATCYESFFRLYDFNGQSTSLSYFSGESFGREEQRYATALSATEGGPVLVVGGQGPRQTSDKAVVLEFESPDLPTDRLPSGTSSLGTLRSVTMDGQGRAWAVGYGDSIVEVPRAGSVLNP